MEAHAGRADATQPTERRRALVVANGRYDDEALARLASPAADADALGRVLADPVRCGFEVTTVLDGSSGEVAEAVEGFLADVERSDLLLLYFSCHGLKDESGRLYFAARNTRRDRLRSTAVAATVVNELLLGSRSRRKVLLLDCCYGGAFARGMQVKADRAVHTAEQFDARGLVVLTASDSTQYAFDGDEVRGSVTPSRFTSVLVDGLSSGAADVDRDGFVTVDDAHEFVRRQLADQDVPQDPRRWEFDVAGRIVLARAEPVAGAGAKPAMPPPAVVAAAPVPATAAPRRSFPGAWWAGALTLLAGSAGVAFILAEWLVGILYDAVPGQYLPALEEIRWRMVALAAVWAVVLARSGVRLGTLGRGRFAEPWLALATAYRDLVSPTGIRSFARGLVSAVPVNVLLVLAASVGAAALGYADSGSEQRDNLFGLVFVVLSIAGFAWYLTAGRNRSR